MTVAIQLVGTAIMETWNINVSGMQIIPLLEAKNLDTGISTGKVQQVVATQALPDAQVHQPIL